MLATSQRALPPGVGHPPGTSCHRGSTDGEYDLSCGVCGVSFPCVSCYSLDGHHEGCPKAEQQLSPDLQASIRYHYWTLVESAGLRTYGTTALAGRLELEVGAARDVALACRYPDHSIRISRQVREALFVWYADPTSPMFMSGSPADAHLTLLHETVHCCGSIVGHTAHGGSSFSSNVDELVTELCARQILANFLGIRASSIFESSQGSYDELINPTAWAVSWAADCSADEAVDRLARAALRLRHETPVIDDLTGLGQLIEFATEDAVCPHKDSQIRKQAAP